MTEPLSSSVLISTFNRSRRLADTLQSIAHTKAPGIAWDVFVVDNNSTDSTREVVENCAASYPVPLHYRFEAHQGTCAARNTGISCCTP